MSYEKQTWVTGDVITAEKLNHMEEGISSGGGLTSDIKDALLQLAEKVAYIDANGQDYYLDLLDALYPISSISAVFTQGQNVIYDTDSLDTLKQYLVVTATFQDCTTATVPAADYTLSGTLVTGTSTVTVTYLGKTTTFTVTVTDFLATLTFEAYPWAAPTTGTYKNYVFKANNATARARCTVPFANNGYTFSIVDTSKYNIAVYGITSLETISATISGQTVDAYPGEDNNVSWGTSGSRTTHYVALSFKKLDNTDFTATELANMYGTVFTATRS